MNRSIIGCVALAMLTACSNGKGDNTLTESRAANEARVLERKENPTMTFLHQKEPTNTVGLPVLDMKKEYPKKTIALQDIADRIYRIGVP